jgi:AMME syndrome candidate gene 1 protein
MATLIPADPAADQPIVEKSQVCIPEHCFYAFDTLFCELTKKKPVAPKFPDEK